jgi:spore coat polysaccharide biosynthesis protein SpsF (cytidylyltransferase family)
MGSSRLPGKVLADLAGRPVLWHVIRRVRQARRVDEVIVATSISQADDPLERFCIETGMKLIRGSEHDVLDRFYQTAVAFQAERIVRLTADCPLIDPDVMDRVIGAHGSGVFDYVSNVIHYTYPDGLDVEVFSMRAMAQAWREAVKPADREHVTPYLRFSNRFRTCNLTHDPDLSHHRWSIDEPADLEFIRRIYAAFDGSHKFRLPDILDLLSRRPELQRLQTNCILNEGYYKSLYAQADASAGDHIRIEGCNPGPIDYTRPSAEPGSEALGRRLQDGFNALAKHAGLGHRFACIGDPVHSELRCTDGDVYLFRREAAKRGVIIQDCHHMTRAHDVAAIEETLAAYAAVLKTLAVESLAC